MKCFNVWLCFPQEITLLSEIRVYVFSTFAWHSLPSRVELLTKAVVVSYETNSDRRQLHTFCSALKMTRDIHCVWRPRCFRTRNVFRLLFPPLYFLPVYVTWTHVANTLVIEGTTYGGLSSSGFELWLKTRLSPSLPPFSFVPLYKSAAIWR
jgi:hypothetical protein